jgi:hypothetical protein
VNENDRPNETLIGVGLLVGLLLIALALALIAGLEWYLDPASKLSIVDRRNLVQGLASAGQALAVFLTGAVGLIGLFFTWKNIIQARDSTRQTLELTERGQITERFTRAIDQLGAIDDNDKEKMEIRLGGIYALDWIDKESPERAYHPTVMDVLTAYVRENSRGKPEDPTLSADIRAIVDILSRREEQRVPKKHRIQNLDLSEAYLWEADFSGADLQGAILHKADLRGAFLRGADLQGAFLLGADLQGAILLGADLQEAENLTPMQIEWTIGSNETKLPEGFNHPELWSKSIEEQAQIVQEHLKGAN